MAAPANTTQSQAEPLATALGPPNHPPGAMLMKRAAWISTERHESASPSWERSATTSKESDPAGTRRRAQSLLTAARVRREFGPSRLRTRVSASVTQTKRLRFRSREWSRPKAARTSGHIRGQGGASMRPFAAVFAARPLSLAGILANSGAPFAAPNVHEGFRGEDETASLSEPRVEPSEGRRERAVTSGGRGALQGGRSRQFSQQDRSLWPEFSRIPAPRSRLRTRMSVTAPPRAPLGACQMKKITGWPAARRVRAPSESG